MTTRKLLRVEIDPNANIPYAKYQEWSVDAPPRPRSFTLDVTAPNGVEITIRGEALDDDDLGAKVREAIAHLQTI